MKEYSPEQIKDLEARRDYFLWDTNEIECRKITANGWAVIFLELQDIVEMCPLVSDIMSWSQGENYWEALEKELIHREI